MNARLALCLSALLLTPSVQAAPACADGNPIPITAPSCAPLKPPTLSCAMPTDVQGALKQPNASTVQRASNLFSWQTFIALNWPVDPAQRGVPAADAPFSAPGPRVWESWKEAYEVYLPEGREPPAWNAAQEMPGICGDVNKLLLRTSKVSDVVDGQLQALPAQGDLPATLKDQQGRLVRYEIRLNRTLFDYIVSERLYDGTVQAKASAVDFPDGSQLIKAAWREIDESQAPNFLSTLACVCDDEDVDQPTGCRVQRMGLAGLHVMSKTPSAPQWIWSTFEQVDNIVSTHADVMPLNDPACPPERCPPNRQTPAQVPSQITRVVPIPNQNPICSRTDQPTDNVAALNADLRKAISAANLALAQYELVNTQWPVPGHSPTRSTEFVVAPAVLANTTMESFAQEASTCMGCHAMSRTLNPAQFVSADFSFTLNNAQPRPPADCEDVEASESCNDQLLPTPHQPPPEAPIEWAVYRGYDYAIQTYELVNQPGETPFVGNRLHCQSCHLHGGGDPEAGWWAGSYQRMGGLEGLQNRINGCFERSMNGRALCTPGTDCDNNTVMSTLIAYMRWLDVQYARRYGKKTPTSGFPPLPEPPLPPSADRGAAVFAQKCAYCHDVDGQGRYLGGYFRPAVWGPDSYNAAAGLGKVETLAAFIGANMPYTSGGLLTPQEAWDVATFIDAQPRPGKD